MDLMNKKTIDDFMTYATAVIKSRAIPLAEDGLKPVLRRILYTMSVMKLTDKAKTVKSANVVGRTMLVHPHGDASIYDALIRMSQNWKMRYPLIEVQGNNGSLNGDPQAASRYTECRLSAAGTAMTENLDPDIIKFVPNYDDTTTEPSMLSGVFPNLLCNGSEGIAVGMSCSLLPHNLNNVIDMIEAHLHNPSLTIDEAVDIIKGPDFPLGGLMITTKEQLKSIYGKGIGTLTLRAKAEIDEKTSSIIFSEFPYLVDVSRIVAAIQDLVLEDNYLDILEYENHIGKNSCYLKIICQKKANLNKVLNDLYEKTPLQKTIKINNTTIYNGVPYTSSLLGLSNIYINHRHNCIIKMAKKELAKQSNQLHIQNGLLVATTSIDSVVAIIRSSDSKEEAKNRLIDMLGIDNEQADAILALQLGRLTRLDVNEIQVKIQKAKSEIEKQKLIINSGEERIKIIESDLEQMRKKFGDDRRTTVKLISAEEKEKEEIGSADTVLTVVGEDGILYSSTVVDDFRKGGKFAKVEPSKWKYSKNKVLVLNDDGVVTEEWQSNSTNLFEVDPTKNYVVTISEKGLAKKTSIAEYKKFTRLAKNKEGDRIMYAFCANLEDNIILHVGNKVQKVSVLDIKESGKLTMGNKITKEKVLKDAFVENNTFYTLNINNQMKRSEVGDLTVAAVNLNDNCVKIGPCTPNTLYYSRGRFFLINWNEISVKGRTSDGAKISTTEIKIS